MIQQLMFDGFKYTPVEPSMVDARNGIIIADTLRFNGAHFPVLFGAFAKRGLGVSASVSPGSFDAQPLLDGWESVVFAAYDTTAAPYGEGQLEIFKDDFEGPNTGWTVAGIDGAGGGPLWHLSSRRSSSATKAYYYGQEATGNYNTGFRNYGSLISPAIKLPATLGNSSLMLEWDQYRQTGDSFFFDGGFVRIIEVGPGTRTQVSFVQNSRTSFGNTDFAHQRVNLNQFAGKTIQVEFFMDTFDSIANSAEGWYVDNVAVGVLGVPNNAGFESAVTPWTAYSGVSGGVNSAVPAHTGNYVLFEDGGEGGFFQDAGGLTPTKAYTISAWVKATLGATAQPLIIVQDTLGAGLAYSQQGPVGTDWKLIQVNFTATATGKVRIHLHRINGSGTLYWDDVRVAVGAPAGSNLGFESGALAPWTVTGGVTATVTSTVVHSGTKALQETGAAGGVFQDIDGLTPGRQYRVSVWARTAAGTTGQGQLNVNDSTGANTVTDGFRTPPSTAWTLFTVNFDSTTSQKVRIQLLWDGGAGTIYWDDVSLTEGTPAPAVVNGSFESGLTGWLPYGTETTRTTTGAQKHSGNFSLQQAGATGGGAGIYQDVGGLIPGRQYKIGVWVLGDGPGTAPAVLVVQDPSGANTVFANVQPGATWRYAEVTFTATQQAIARILLHLYAGTGNVFYDDVTIQ